MDINYHYFAVKVLTINAGFNPDDAQLLATYSQFVDDFDTYRYLWFDDVPEYAQYLAYQIGSKWLFNPVTTGFTSFFDYARLETESNQKRILIPFHFITQNPLTVPTEDRKDYRVQPVTMDQVSLLQSLLQSAANQYKFDPSHENMMRIGLLLHIYADTYAHQRFSGFWGWENHAYLNDVVDNVSLKNITASYSPDMYYWAPSIGHPNVSTAPDDSNVSFTMLQKYIEYEKFPYKASYSRSNALEYQKCSREILNYLRSCRGLDKIDDTSWNELAAKLNQGFMTTDKDVSKLAANWSKIFPNITFNYVKPSTVGLGLVSAADQALAANNDDILSALLNNETHPELEQYTLTGNDDFFRYNVLADQVRKAVDPSFTVDTNFVKHINEIQHKELGFDSQPIKKDKHLSCLTDLENKFMREVEANGGTLYHDYSNDLHYQYALSRLGGEEYLKTNYPLAHQLFETTRQKHLAMNCLGVVAPLPSEDGFSDALKVVDITYDKEHVISTMTANFIQDKPTISISARLIDKTNDRIEDTIQVYDDDISKLDGEIKKLASELIQSNDREFTTISDFFWMVGDDPDNPGGSSCTTVYSDFKVEGTNTIISNFVVNDPIVKKTPSRDHVVVVYNRAAQVDEDYDYFFDNNKFHQGDRDWVKVYLPASGTVTVNNDFNIVGFNQQMGSTLQIEDLNKGVVNYYNTPYVTTISADKKQITWKFNDYWNNNLDVTNFGAKTTVNIYNKMEIDIVKVSTGMKMHIPVVFKSYGSPSEDKSVVISKPIMIQWGCVGKDTQILMADHQYKSVTDINIGDVVLNESMEAITVRNIYTGPEEMMVYIETDKHKQVLVTAGHPVATNIGIIAAAEITPANTIKTVDGFEEIQTLKMVAYNDTVYSLCFAEANTIIGNGIILGDFSLQQNLLTIEKPKPVINHSDNCINAREEFKQLLASLVAK